LPYVVRITHAPLSLVEFGHEAIENAVIDRGRCKAGFEGIKAP
jgi:hypothetical protein